MRPLRSGPKRRAARVVNALGSVYHGSMIEFEAYSANIGYWVVDGFEIDGTIQPHDGYRLGIDMRGMTHMTVKNCTVHDTYKTGIFPAFADYALIANNTIYNAGEHGIYNCNSGDYGVNRNNVSHDNTGNGIQCNADVSAGGDGIMTGWLLERNILYNNANGFNLPGIVSSTFRNNSIYDNRSKGFSIYGGEGALCANSLRILNNNVIMPHEHLLLHLHARRQEPRTGGDAHIQQHPLPLRRRAGHGHHLRGDEVLYRHAVRLQRV